MVPRRDAFFASPGDPEGVIPAKVKLHQRDVLFAILAVAASQADVDAIDVDRALKILNTREGNPPDTNSLLAEEVKKVLLSLKDQLGAQHSQAQEALAG